MKGDRRMINLQSITEENWLKVTELTVNEEQKKFLAPPIGILARAYVYRNCNGKVYVIADDSLIVGVSLVRKSTAVRTGSWIQYCRKKAIAIYMKKWVIVKPEKRK